MLVFEHYLINDISKQFRYHLKNRSVSMTKMAICYHWLQIVIHFAKFYFSKQWVTLC
jgi:hypothetical protein